MDDLSRASRLSYKVALLNAFDYPATTDQYSCYGLIFLIYTDINMSKDIQYLKSLKTFQIAAQLLSFTKAAESLFITQAAVSHQIRLLEEQLGFALFHRMTRKVALTSAGEALLETVSKAFASIEQVVDQLRKNAHQSHRLTVALTPAFSTRWLVKKLPLFWASHPEIEIKLHHTLQPIDLRREQVDAAIRWGDGNWPGLVVEPLFGTTLSPVCAPGYIKPENPLDTPSDLSAYTLLHEDNYGDWIRWQRAAGCDQIDTRFGTAIDDSNVLLMAAMAGQGVALGRLALIQAELDSGQLIKPFDCNIESEGKYWLVYEAAQLEHPAFLNFQRFLHEQIASHQTPLGS